MLCAPFERLNSPDPLDDAVPTGACQIHHNFELAEQILSTATAKHDESANSGAKPSSHRET